MLDQHVRLDCEMFTYARWVGDSLASARSRDKLPVLKISNTIRRSPFMLSTDSGVMAKAADAAAKRENHRRGPMAN